LQPPFNLTLQQQEFTTDSIHELARLLLQQLQPYKIWAFDSPMGSGKTTLIHALCDVLQVSDAVGSPTFSIINQYEAGDGRIIYHLDLYRIRDEEEALQAGVEEVLHSGEFCLVEWPGKTPALFPADTVYLHLEVTGSNSRRLTIQVPN
jgi:tRNA threonylcarbamoyladenosine biosynthesis protein TsaE